MKKSDTLGVSCLTQKRDDRYPRNLKRNYPDKFTTKWHRFGARTSSLRHAGTFFRATSWNGQTTKSTGDVTPRVSQTDFKNVYTLKSHISGMAWPTATIKSSLESWGRDLAFAWFRHPPRSRVGWNNSHHPWVRLGWVWTPLAITSGISRVSLD